MIFLAHQPSPPLSQYVELFWFVHTTMPYNREKILPSKNIELMFNFGAPFRNYADEDTTQFDLKKRCWVAGLQNSFILNEPIAETNMIGVRFKPGGAFPFLGLPMQEIQNHVLDMDLIWGSLIEEWREQLLTLSTPQERFRHLERLLLARLDDKRRDVQLVQAVASRLASVSGHYSIRIASDEVGISQKHLITLFKKQVGMSPKQFARLLKFQSVLHAIDPTKPINWGEIAFACHYYDQAHFNRDFKQFTGLTPATYVSNRHQYLGELSQGEEVNFVPIG